METRRLQLLINNISSKAIVLAMAFCFINYPIFSKESKSFAEKLKKHSIGIGVGQTFLFGDFDNTADDGVTVLNFYHVYEVSYSFDLFTNLHFNTLDSGSEEIELFGLTTSIRTNIFKFDSFSPFIFGGFGFYRPRATSEENNELSQTQSEIVFGLNGGTGVDLELSPHYTISLLAQYHLPFDVEQDQGPSLDGSYLQLLIGFFYNF